MQTRSTFLRRALIVGAAIAFAPTRIDKVLLPSPDPANPFASPLGSMAQFAPGRVPDGWLEADGRALAKTDYPDLYAVFGTAYGGRRVGRTFRLPDLRGRVPGRAAPVGDPALYAYIPPPLFAIRAEAV